MAPILDPRLGDAEDDASSTKSRRLASIAGSMLAEISLPKLFVAWMMLIGIPGIVLGMAPLLASAWLSKVSDRLYAISSIGSLAGVAIILILSWYGIRPAFRFIEGSFWALHALAVQPAYAFFRESLSQLAEAFLDEHAGERERSRRRALMATLAGVLSSVLAAALVFIAWPATQWVATWETFASPSQLIVPALANAVTIVGGYLMAASLAWGISDALMEYPIKIDVFAAADRASREWRIAHLSDLHVVGERYGCRIESGRSGPRGNERFEGILRRLDALNRDTPLDVVLVTGDMTDAGRSAEWAEFFEHLSQYPELVARMIVLPGNHDVNIAERSNPAKVELPISPRRSLRHMRTLSAMEFIQGRRAHVCDRTDAQISHTLSEALEPSRSVIASLSSQSRVMARAQLSHIWADVFPLVFPPEGDGGLGILVLNSNAQSNFSFTNALGLVPVGDISLACQIMERYPNSGWIVAIHHHVVEYPLPVKVFSERIGTALINGNLLVKRLGPFAKRIIIMHGHRHIDWIGRVGALTIVSAPSPVMNCGDHGTTYFYVHTVYVDAAGGVELAPPQRVDVDEPAAADC